MVMPVGSWSVVPGGGTEPVPFQIMTYQIHDAGKTQQVCGGIGQKTKGKMEVEDALNDAHRGFVWREYENHVQVRNHQYE